MKGLELAGVLQDSEGVLLTLRVQPGSSREGLSLDPQGTLKVRISAHAHEGQANQRLVRFLSKALGVPKSAVTIVRGEKSREKQVRIEGITTCDVSRLVE